MSAILMTRNLTILININTRRRVDSIDLTRFCYTCLNWIRSPCSTLKRCNFTIWPDADAGGRVDSIYVWRSWGLVRVSGWSHACKICYVIGIHRTGRLLRKIWTMVGLVGILRTIKLLIAIVSLIPIVTISVSIVSIAIISITIVSVPVSMSKTNLM